MNISPDKRIHLATKAKLALGAATLLISCTLLVVYLHLTFFSDKLSATRSETIPSLVHSSTLAQQSMWLREQMEQAIATPNPLIQEHIVSTMQSYDAYKTTLMSLREVHATPDMLMTLETEFNTLRNLIIKAILNHMELGKQHEQMRYIYNRLHTLLQKLSYYPAQTKAEQQLIALTTRLISRMLALHREKKEWVVSNLISQCTAEIAHKESLSASLDNEQTSQANLEKIFDECSSLLTSPAGLITSKRKELVLSTSFTETYTRASFMGATIVQSCTQLLKSSESKLLQVQEHTIQRFSTVQHITFSFFAILLIMFMAMYLFLQRNVLKPIKRLTRAITDGIATVQQGKDYTTPLPISGEPEIQDIAQATSFFLQEITAQRAALAQSHAHLEEQVRERTKNITTLSGKLIQAQETERKRIAAELHDDVGATISVIKIGIEHAAHMMNVVPLPIEDITAGLQKQKQLIQQVAAQLRAIQTDLTPPYLELGLHEALQVLCEDYNMMHGRIKFSYTFSAKNVPEKLHLAIYRILQEGLTNILKHSECSKARIALCRDDDSLLLSIEDNGIDFSKTPSSGMGLLNIEERAIVSGGTLRFEQTPKWKGLIVEWKLHDNQA